VQDPVARLHLTDYVIRPIPLGQFRGVEVRAYVFPMSDLHPVPLCRVSDPPCVERHHGSFLHISDDSQENYDHDPQEQSIHLSLALRAGLVVLMQPASTWSWPLSLASSSSIRVWVAGVAATIAGAVSVSTVRSWTTEAVFVRSHRVGEFGLMGDGPRHWPQGSPSASEVPRDPVDKSDDKWMLRHIRGENDKRERQ
jgi:hypothetical protein